MRQLQEIRTYYDFPDIDIDRYVIDGTLRQVMLATRELNTAQAAGEQPHLDQRKADLHARLRPDDERGQRLHPGRAADAAAEETCPSRARRRASRVTRPEVYFGEMTNTDVYVKTRQQEFNYPQGQTNSLTSYEGTGGILLDGRIRRLLIALDRGDIGKLPFSDDVTAESRLLMRRNVRDRVAALAPFLQFDPDPYIVLGADGRLSWMMDAFTTSDHYPFSAAVSCSKARASTTCATASRR